MKGTVKWFNSIRGFGFITGEDAKDIFVHKNSMPDGTRITDGDNVEYNIQETNKGLSAVEVKKL